MTTSSGRRYSFTLVPGAHMRAVRRAVEQESADAKAAAGFRHRAEHVDLADEIGDERRRRLSIDLLRRADLLDHSLIHDHDAVRHRQRLFLIVGDHDRRHAEALLQCADLSAQAQALDRIERGQRLVEQEQARRRRERTRQRDALLLAAGELSRDTWGPQSASPTSFSSSRDTPMDFVAASCAG